MWFYYKEGKGTLERPGTANRPAALEETNIDAERLPSSSTPSSRGRPAPRAVKLSMSGPRDFGKGQRPGARVPARGIKAWHVQVKTRRRLTAPEEFNLQSSRTRDRPRQAGRLRRNIAASDSSDDEEGIDASTEDGHDPEELAGRRGDGPRTRRAKLLTARVLRKLWTWRRSRSMRTGRRW